MTKPEFKDLFLSLTEYTVPFGTEQTLESLLPPGFRKDPSGNYVYEIGTSDTMFTTHLDTYSQKREPVSQMQAEDDEYVILTDGTTILGGDNKLGCTILIGLIKDRVPGTYFFFVGEEPILSGGLWGSRAALSRDPAYFRRFRRCVAFDRRQYGSIVSRQMARTCASDEFVAALAKELKSKGNIDFDPNSCFGYYTDTATFMDVIPECTNISAGGFGEHTLDEWVDLNYAYDVYLAARQIKWDSLPVRREIKDRFRKGQKTRGIKGFLGFGAEKRVKDLKQAMSEIDDLLLTRDYHDGKSRRLTYSTWLKDLDVDIWVSNSRIYMDERMRSPLSIQDVVSRAKTLLGVEPGP